MQTLNRAARVAALLALMPAAVALGQREGEPPVRSAAASARNEIYSIPEGDDWPDPQAVESRGALTAKVGIGRLVTLPDEVERVALANEAVARVQVISPREVLLTGLAPGQTTVHVWLADGRRFQYIFRCQVDLDLVERALRDLDPRILVEAANDGSSIVLHGEVPDRITSIEAENRASSLLGATRTSAPLLNLLRYPGSVFSVEEALQELLWEIDPRILVRRIQVGPEPDTNQDTFVLEGRVRDVQALVRAVTLAERQLGGTGLRVGGAPEERVENRRRQNFGGSTLGGRGGRGGANAFGGNNANADPRSSSLVSQLARGQVVTSESGRVVSLLELDLLHQVMVSIRVLEVDRTKTRKAGINFRIDAEDVSIGSYTAPGVEEIGLPGIGGPSRTARPTVDSLNGLGNAVGAFIDQTQAIVAAFDFLQEKNLARAVAEPNVLTLSGELATVLVGGEVPIPSTSANQVTTFSGFFFQDFGVRLDIRPTVTDEDLVALEVSPSIVRPSPGLGVSGVPGFVVQSVTTTARVQAGQSLAIGGLLMFEEGLEDRRVPGLGKIPLFRWKRKSRQERELLFLITPRLVVLERQERDDAVVDPTPELDEIELPELNWPYDRGHWRDSFEPIPLPPDGIPADFWVEPEEWVEYAGETLPGGYAVEEAMDEAAGGYAEDGDADGEEIWFDADPVSAAEPTEMVVDPTYWLVVAKPCLNLRGEPGMWNQPLDCLPPGTRVEVFGSYEGWVRVRLADDREGWVAREYLEAVIESWEEVEGGGLDDGEALFDDY